MTQTSNFVDKKPILILLAGRTFPEISETENDFDEWIALGLGSSTTQLRMDAQTASSLPSPSELSGVVISGSHSMVTDHQPWSEQLAQWLKTCVEVNLPVLGICYGHQLLAYACGGLVADHPAGIEIGTKPITLSADAKKDYLFSDMPPIFAAQLVHSQSVLTLPDDAVLLASSEHESHQAFCIGKCAWGVQFHPEFSASAMRGYINQLHELLVSQQRDFHALNAAVQETPDAALLLRKFAAYTGF